MSVDISPYEIVKKILDEAYELRVHDLSESMSLTEKAIQLSREYKLPSLTGSGLSRLALYNMIRGEHEASLKMSNEAIEIYKTLDDERGIAIAKYSLAGIYYKSNNYHLGMVYLLDCLISFKKIKDYHNESRTLKSIGTIYDFLNDSHNAKLSYEAAIVAAQNAKDLNLESNTYNPLSGLLLKLGENKRAMQIIKLSIQLKTETNDQRGIAFAIYGRAKVHMYNKDFQKAEKDFVLAVKLHESFGEMLGVSMARNKLARLWMLKGDRDKAKTLLKNLVAYTEKNNSVFIYLKASRFLSEIYSEDGDTAQSLEYLQKYIKKKEDTNNVQIMQVIENYERGAIIKSSEREARLELEKKEIIAAKNHAEQVALVKQDFLSAMSHEIRTPLNAVTGIIALLENRSSKDEQELITSLRFSSKNLLRIINDILDFSKLDSNKMLLDPRPVRFHTLIDNIKSTYVGMAAEKGLTLNMDLSTLLAPAYHIDETKLFQILGNLLSNAIKFTNKGEINIVIDLVDKHEEGHSIVFKISDTGVGIAKSELEKLFESFYISQSVTTKEIGGTGLGLAIVKRMVALHGSEIKVESVEGEGSSFYFVLKCDFAPTPREVTKDLFKLLNGKTALLAEDNEVNALVMNKLFEKYKIRVYRAKDGEEVIKLSHKMKVDIILMDIHMPKLNGFEAAKIIRTQDNINCNTPIFALTADITAMNENEYVHYFDDFLTKPVEIERLFAAFLRVNAKEDIIDHIKV